MDKLVDALIGIIKPPWSYIIGVAALLVITVPRILDLRQDWFDVRIGRRKFELEKLHLEIIKLRMELGEVLKGPEKAEIEPEDEASIIKSAQESEPSPPTAQPRGGLRGLMARHPKFARPVLLLG